MSAVLTLVKGCFQWLFRLLTGRLSAVEASPTLVVVVVSEGRHLPQKLPPDWDVLQLKQAVAPKFGLRHTQLDIVLAGKRLNNSTLIQVKIDYYRPDIVYLKFKEVMCENAFQYIHIHSDFIECNLQMCKKQWFIFIKLLIFHYYYLL